MIVKSCFDATELVEFVMLDTVIFDPIKDDTAVLGGI